MNGWRDDEVVAYKIVWVGLESSKWLSERFLVVGRGQGASMDTSFDTQLSDNPLFFSEATLCLLEGKMEFYETSDTVDQRVRGKSGLQWNQWHCGSENATAVCSKAGVDTSKSNDTSLMD